jgi:hypothetical protein
VQKVTSLYLKQLLHVEATFYLTRLYLKQLLHVEATFYLTRYFNGSSLNINKITTDIYFYMFYELCDVCESHLQHLAANSGLVFRKYIASTINRHTLC